MSTETPYFGIDFGTTNSSMAWYDPDTGRADVILNEEGEDKTPSLVYFGEDELIVGKYAEAKLEEVENSTDPQERDEVSLRIVRSIKRNLLDPPIIPLPGREPVRPVEVVEHIMRKLKRDAEEEHFNEEVGRAVITCPATFDEQQKQVLLDGAAMAGFDRVELIEEPTAAALTVTKQGQRIGSGLLIYDLGAGTFDLSVVARDNETSPFYVIEEPQGDPQCGGDDLDLALYDYCDGIVLEELGRHISLTEGVVDLAFLRECRSRKHNLSKSEKGIFSSLLSSEEGSQRFRQTVDRETFENLIRSQTRIEDTVRMTARLWDEVKDRVDAVVLIGGSSRVPLVRERLEEALGVKPRSFAEKDRAVALGAAYQAYKLWSGTIDDGEDVAPEIKEYRRALRSCWNDRWLSRHEVEWLARLASEELHLDPEDASGVERQVMDDTIEDILGTQEPVARDRYATVLRLGWKDRKLDALRRIPSVRLNMLLNDQDRFCDFDFEDSPISAQERKEMASGLPWSVFVMAARVVTDPHLSNASVAGGLDTIADELGLSRDLASAIESEELGSPIGSALERQEKAVRDGYRKAVGEAYKQGKLTPAKVKALEASAHALGLNENQARAIERGVLGDTASNILADDKAVTELIARHGLVRSRISGSGKGGRITKQDAEAYIKNREGLRKLKSKLVGTLDKHGNKFPAQCEDAAKKIMARDSNWQDNLGNCLGPALKAYAAGIQREAQAEVDKLKPGLRVPTFSAPALSAEITAGKTYSDTGEVVGGVGGGLTGAAGGALLGSAIFPVVGTAIGGVLGGLIGTGMGAEALGDTTGTLDKDKTLTEVRSAAEELRPRLKVEAKKYLDRVEKDVAARLGVGDRCVVAVVGQVKVGKSTFVNALLGGNLAEVGTTETTATINYFTHGKPPDDAKPVRCHWRGGKQTWEDRDFLDGLQGKDLETLRRADGVDRLEYFLEHRFLEQVTLVDTPGTNAVVEEHQNVTAEFMKLRNQLRERHHEDTERLGRDADAVIYLIGAVAMTTDEKFLEEFARTTGGRSSALNAVGVMSRIETQPKVLAQRHELARDIASQLKKELNTVIPVGSGVHRALDSLLADDRAGLLKLIDAVRRIPSDRLEMLLVRDTIFLKRDFEDCPVSAEERRALFEGLPEDVRRWPIFATLVRTAAEPGLSLEEVEARLREISNFDDLKQILDKHFIERGHILRCFRIVHDARRVLRKIKFDHLRHGHRGIREERDRLDRFVGLIRQAGGDPTTTKELEAFVYEHLDVEAQARQLEDIYRDLDTKISGLYWELEHHNADFEALQKLEEFGHEFSEEERTELQPLLGLRGSEVEKRLPPGKADPDFALQRMLQWRGKAEQAPFGSVRRFVAERAYARYGIVYKQLNERLGSGVAVSAEP